MLRPAGQGPECLWRLSGGNFHTTKIKLLNLMKKGIGLALIVVGVMLVIYGVNASNSASSGISQIFTGAPTDKSLWLLLGGIGSAITGTVMAVLPAGRT
jgi:hypothetical protein